MTELVIGADIGGTSTRVAVATTTGEVLACCSGGPGNPTVVGLAESAAEIRSVMDQAFDQVAAADGGRSPNVVSVVIGLAGVSRAAADPSFARAATSGRVTTAAQLVADLTVAFYSATAAPEGCVLVAGTGAVAGRVVGSDLVQQRDGFGWLLGDEGSGFWLGRAAVRATLQGLQQGAPLGPLQRSVLAATGTTGYLDLLQASYNASPAGLAQYATLVSRHVADDPVAADIATQAVVLLERLLLSLEPGPDSPIVLAGSVLTPDGPVGAGLRERLARGGANPVLTSSPGVVGALWIGLRSRVLDDTAVHGRLVRTLDRWL